MFSITDGKGREPITCPVRADNPEAKLRAIYFSEKYGLVFGTTDLILNFNNMQESSSKLGSIYDIPTGLTELALAGKETNWEVEEIEIFGLTLFTTSR